MLLYSTEFYPRFRIEGSNMEDSTILNTTAYLEALAQGNGLSEIENLIMQGLELIHVGKGIVRCKLLVTDRVAVIKYLIFFYTIGEL